MRRVDKLDIAFAIAGAIAVAGLLLGVATTRTAGLIVAAPAAAIVFIVSCIDAWSDGERARIEGAPRLNRLLPWGMVIAGIAVAVGALTRLIWGDGDDWFTRYVMSALWTLIGLDGVNHGVERMRATADTGGVQTECGEHVT